MEITLSGFGDFSEDATGLRDLRGACKRHKVSCTPTYYDHELRGDADAIEAITMELWGMPRDQWADNALNEELVVLTP